MTNANSTYPTNNVDHAAIDLDSLLNRCMGRLDLMDRILLSFRRSAGQEIEELFTAISQTDRDTIVRKAHKLKGTSLTASANALADVADALHRTAHEAQSSEFESFSEKLTCEFDTILRLLDTRELGASHEAG